MYKTVEFFLNYKSINKMEKEMKYIKVASHEAKK
jgi:hypothetical protein